MSPEEVQELLKKQREELEEKQLRLGQIKQQVAPKKARVSRKYGLDISTLRKPALVAIAKALGKTGSGSVAEIGKQINEALSASGEVVWDLPDIKAILEREKEAVEEKEEKEWLTKSQRKALKRQMKQEEMAMKQIDQAYKEAETASRKAQRTGNKKDKQLAEEKRRKHQELVEGHLGLSGEGLHPLVGGALFAHDLIHRQCNDLLHKHSDKKMIVDVLNKVKKHADNQLLKVGKTHGGGWFSSLIKPMVNAGKSLSSIGSSVKNMIAPAMNNMMGHVARGVEMAKPLVKQYAPVLAKKGLEKALNLVPIDDAIKKAISPHLDKLVDAGVKKMTGGGIFDSFLAGVTAPFRYASKINPIFGFGVDKVADALNIPTVSDVINK
jgi:hypothetical protein